MSVRQSPESFKVKSRWLAPLLQSGATVYLWDEEEDQVRSFHLGDGLLTIQDFGTFANFEQWVQNGQRTTPTTRRQTCENDAQLQRIIGDDLALRWDQHRQVWPESPAGEPDHKEDHGASVPSADDLDSDDEDAEDLRLVQKPYQGEFPANVTYELVMTRPGLSEGVFVVNQQNDQLYHLQWDPDRRVMTVEHFSQTLPELNQALAQVRSRGTLPTPVDSDEVKVNTMNHPAMIAQDLGLDLERRFPSGVTLLVKAPADTSKQSRGVRTGGSSRPRRRTRGRRCGARTHHGSRCSRRVRSKTRCWQHVKP